jgi:O-acetylhomoserine/O-acetylserine sulfhydrylase-like pyridoxal-dependent enzyme
MPITQAMPTSFKVEILQAVHNFGPTTPNVFKMALYTNSATLSAATTVYSATNEVVSANYTAGGLALTISTTPTSGGTTAFISFTSPVTWSGVTFTTRGALIYNSTQANKAVAVIDFGTDQIVSGGDFNVIFPAAAAATAILRIE